MDEKHRTPYPHNKAFTTFSMPLTARHRQGKEFPLVPLFIDLISDVAILGPSDELEHYSGKKFDPGIFRRFATRLKKSIPRFVIDLNPSLDIRWMKALVYTHQMGWQPIKVRERLERPNQMIIESEEPIRPGTSGGTIVTNRGKLLGVVTNAFIQAKTNKCLGSFAHAAAVLPTRYHWEMEDQETEEHESLNLKRF